MAPNAIYIHKFKGALHTKYSHILRLKNMTSTDLPLKVKIWTLGNYFQKEENGRQFGVVGILYKF